MTFLRKAILFLALATMLCGCSDNKIYRIGVSQCSHDDWRSKMNDEILREIMFHPEAVVEIRSAEDSNDKQIADIKYFTDNHFDIIIAAPNEADAITPVIHDAYSKGIPVVIFDRNINGNSYTAYQGVDNANLGASAAHYADHLIKGGSVIEIYGLPGSTPAIGRHNGFVNALADSSGTHLIATGYGNWNYDDAAAAADSLLSIYPDIDLIYAHNDRMAIAAADIAKAKGLDPYIIGIDAAPEIGIKAVADGVIDATFLYPTEGHRLIRTALAILKGEPFDTLVTLPVASPVDISNADILLLQNESLKEETHKMEILKSQVDEYWSQHSAQTTLFYAAIVILILLFGFLFMILRSFRQHKRHQAELLGQNRLLQEQRDLQQSLNRQLQEATQSKLSFFTNVSHDLRTPLTLIAGPIEQIAGSPNLTQQQHSLLQIADKNIRILHRLINQILDFRKFENGKLDLHLSEVNLPDLMKEWAESFYNVAMRRDIKLTIDIDLDSMTAAVDTGKIERIFFNLMSNAFKYTPDNGNITFSFRQDCDSVTFAVADSGCGIANDDIANIFERFYQVDKIHPNGSGIGLSLVKAFVELHNGTITVESEPGKGSVFTVTLPVRHIEQSDSAEISPVLSRSDIEAELNDIPEPEQKSADPGKPLLLIIDDNADIRRMISELLSHEYNIITASDGAVGVRYAARYVPDIVICDVMMPVMDGFECCRRIKDEISTSHIPVLMLTACSMDEQRVGGYDSGADGYIAKPFNIAVLEAKCRSLIANRKRIHELWHGAAPYAAPIQPQAVPSGNALPGNRDIDSDFYNRFIDILKPELGNSDLNVDMLASRMGLGRSQFYRKIKALTNYSPVELLRHLRLKAARDMLTTTERSVSEIAYEVGFSSPAYFTRCYREAFGETPSDLRERIAAR